MEPESHDIKQDAKAIKIAEAMERSGLKNPYRETFQQASGKSLRHWLDKFVAWDEAIEEAWNKGWRPPPKQSYIKDEAD